MAKAMLEGSEKVLLVQKVRDSTENYMFQKLARDTSERNWSIVFRKRSATLFEEREDMSRFPVSRDCTKVH